MTHTVFLVEDELIIREGIRDNVDWSAAGFTFCGDAGDGETALPLITAVRPDLLITDIKMPFIDGLELCRAVRAALPATRIVVLSGHDEFRYAQEAIRLGVAEYLLKPVSAAELLELLRRIGAELDREQAERARLHGLETSAADVEAAAAALLERLRDLGTRRSADSADRADGADSFSGQARRAAEKPAAAQAALVAPAARTAPVSPAAVLELDAAALAAFLKSGGSAEVDPFLERYLAPLGPPETIAPQLLHYLLLTVIVATAGCVRELGGDPAAVLGAHGDLDRWPAELDRAGPVVERARAVLAAGLAFRDGQTRHQRALVARVREYLDQHYADAEVSLGAAASLVGLSPSYLSVIFSREVGKTFVEYLTAARVSRAMELLRTTDMTVGEIAYRVGYSSPSYFYSVFKKAVGQSPVDFREQLWKHH